MSLGAFLLVQAAPASSPSASAPAREELRLDPEAFLRPEDLENPAQAESTYRRALDRSRDPGEQAELLIKLGLLADRLGHPSRALDLFEEALQRARQSRSAMSEARALAYSGSVASNLGELGTASNFYRQALEKWKRLGSLSGRLMTLQDLARLHLQVGEPARALDLLGEARRLAPNDAGTLHLLGMSFFLGARDGFALGFLHRALDQARLEGDTSLQAAVLADMGSVELRLKNASQAAASFEACLRISEEKKIPRLQAYARAGLGRVLGLKGRIDEAMVELDRADAMFRSLQDPESLAIVLAGKATLERERGNLQKALKISGEAVDLIEAQRREIESPRTRAALLGVSSDPYEIQIDVLWRLGQQAPGRGFETRAFEVSEKIRARTLYEGLVAYGTSRRPEIASVERQRREVTLRLRALEREKLRLREKSGEKERLRRGEIEAATRGLLASESALWEKLRRSGDPRSALTGLQPLTLPQAQALLDGDTAFLVYMLGQQRSFVWWIERDSFSMQTVPDGKTIEALAQKAQSLLAGSKPKEAELKAAFAALSEAVLSPVADRLPRVRNVIVVPDGALQTLPFAAFPQPRAAGRKAGEPLVVSHVLGFLPSPSTLAALRRREAGRATRPDKRIAVINDPVFAPSDPRIVRPPSLDPPLRQPERARLRYTGKEAQTILSFVPPGMGRKISGFEAVPEVVKEPDLRRYRYLHFGTHGQVNRKDPELSGVVLSQFTPDGQPRDGLLHFYDVYDLDLPVELVSLSTCRSADGPQVHREGPITMTRSFFYAGASRVLGTLWDVDDRSAAELTTTFYAGVLRDGKSPSEALRDAQDAMRRKGWPLRDWAAFVLQGDWR